MKKFSKINNLKVNELPKVEVGINESDVIKNQLLSLMDKFLKIQSYGSVDNRFLSGSVKIQGKELLSEAILDLLINKTSKDKIKLLESLKADIKDWEVLDNKIDGLIKREVNINNRNKFKKMIESYDADSLLINFKKKIRSINDIIVLEDYKELLNVYNLPGKDLLIREVEDRLEQIK